MVSAWTGIPVESMSQDEKQKLVALGDVLKVRVWWWWGGGSAPVVGWRWVGPFLLPIGAIFLLPPAC